LDHGQLDDEGRTLVGLARDRNRATVEFGDARDDSKTQALPAAPARTTVYPDDIEGLHKLACYLMRAPVNLSRLRFDRDSGLLLYEPKRGDPLDDDALTDPLEFLARVLIHIPEPNKHLVHFYGAYANRVRRTYQAPIRHEEQGEVKPTTTTTRRAANKRWRELIYRVYEVDVTPNHPSASKTETQRPTSFRTLPRRLYHPFPE
jgi:Putative transposase